MFFGSYILLTLASSLAEFAEKLQLRKSLKSYLSSCVANCVRNLYKEKAQQTVPVDKTELISRNTNCPDQLVMSAEVAQRINHALVQLPYPQREVIILHLQQGLRFKTIAEAQDVSINTIQSRYRYGLDKLRSLLDSEV